MPVPAPVAQQPVPTGAGGSPASAGPSQVAMANVSSTDVQPTPMGDLQASWGRITAAVVLVGFATVGVGSVAMPYLKKSWRWFMGKDTDSKESSESKKLADVLDKHAQQQQELFKQVKDVATAVKTLQVLSSRTDQQPCDCATCTTIRLHLHAYSGACLRTICCLAPLLSKGCQHQFWQPPECYEPYE